MSDCNPCSTPVDTQAKLSEDFFARITNYLYISVVLDPPLLIMKCMNWSMASGCLASVCANS
jgi:hypothetical protein